MGKNGRLHSCIVLPNRVLLKASFPTLNLEATDLLTVNSPLLTPLRKFNDLSFH